VELPPHNHHHRRIVQRDICNREITINLNSFQWS